MKKEVMDAIEETGLIVIARNVGKDDLFNVAQALVDGGVRLMEIPFDIGNTQKTAEIAKNIEELKDKFGSDMHFGAGTVLTKEQVNIAHECGAELVVSPDTNPSVIEAAAGFGLVCIPGAYSPSEITLANRCGADYVKLFPATQAGEQYIKMICEPLGHIRLLAFGGITLENYKRFLLAGVVGAGVGSALINDRYIASGNYQIITNMSRQFVRTKQTLNA